LVLRGIARTRKISAPNKKEPLKSKLEDFEDTDPEEEEVVSDALLERQDRAKEAEAARVKTAEERRLEQLKLREDRKKAYEARRAKLIEEREAKRNPKPVEPPIEDKENQDIEN
jgi:hypothetical protein